MIFTMNRWLLFFFMAFVSLSASMHLHAQDYPMLHYTIEDGLPSNNIYHIYKDSKGFLWFATDKGIARYNGLKFETFTTFDGLPDNEVFLFKEDYSGRLWLSTYNGQLCYYKDGIFHTAANTPFLRLPFKAPHIYNITLEKDSSITFNFYDCYILVNIKNDKLNFFDFKQTKHLKDSVADLGMFYILYKRKFSANAYELIYRHGIYIVDTMYNIIKSINKEYTYNLLFIPSQDSSYFTTPECIFSHNLDTIHSLSSSVFNKRFIHAYYTDGLSSFIATNKGLVVNDTIEFLKNDNVSSITQDVSSNFWISTLNNGVFCLKKDFLHTKYINNIYNEQIKFCQNINNNIVFITYDNNAYIYNVLKSKCIFNYRNYKKDTYVFSRDGAYLINLISNTCYYFNKEEITIHSTATGATRVCSYSNAVDTFGTKEAFLIGNNVYIRGRSNISIINYSELNKSNRVAHKYAYNDNKQRIFAMALCPDNSLWYSTLTNMYRIIDTVVVALPQFKDISFKYFIFFDKYLIGYTHGNQLLTIDYKNDNKVDTIPAQNCIWDKIYKLDATHLLVSTNNLYRLLTFDPLGVRKKFSIAAIENPFIPKQAESICIDSSSCYFFKNGSLTSVNIKSFLEKPMSPNLFFSYLKTIKRIYSINNRIEVPYDEAKNIIVSFSRVVFVGQDIFEQYSVSKNGQDNWRDVSGEEINLINPGFGTYEIKVRAKSTSSAYGVPAVFTMIVLRPFWATWWFMLLVICGAALMIAFIVRYRTAYMLRKNEKEHETEIKFMRSEYKALNALMNPHFIFNTLNNVQGLVNRNDKLAANEYLRVFADLIRQNMHNISKELIPLQKEIELVINYLLLEKLRFKEYLNYSVNIDEGIDLSEILIPPLLVQPLVENSVKHGILPLESADGCVVIKVYERNAMLYIEVRDNGIGMVQSQSKKAGSLHESFGMENIKKRIQQLSIIQNREIKLNISEVKDDDGQLQWTVVTISMLIA